MGSLALSRTEVLDQPAPSIAGEVARIAREQLAPLAAGIDDGSVYPAEVLRKLGEVGAWGSHMPHEGPADLRCAIQAMSAIGEVCGSTAFMAWCQNTLVWYAANSTNMKLAKRFGDAFSTGRVLGGTGLSNPMKSFFGIEKIKLKGRKVEGGYVVRGALPWVSNLGPDHYFGTIFEREDAPGEIVMFLADCADPAISLQPCKPFLAMDGTGTYGVQFRDAFVPDELILADPAGPFVKKIRAGFILLQAGMALGLIKDCIRRLGRHLRCDRQSLLDRQRRIARPFVPGAEIHPDILHAGVLERQEGVGGTRSLEAVEIDRRGGRNADGGAFRQNLVLGFEAR